MTAPATLRVTLALPPDTRQALERLATHERRTMSATVALLVEHAAADLDDSIVAAVEASVLGADNA